MANKFNFKTNMIKRPRRIKAKGYQVKQQLILAELIINDNKNK